MLLLADNNIDVLGGEADSLVEANNLMTRLKQRLCATVLLPPTFTQLTVVCMGFDREKNLDNSDVNNRGKTEGLSWKGSGAMLKKENKQTNSFDATNSNKTPAPLELGKHPIRDCLTFVPQWPTGSTDCEWVLEDLDDFDDDDINDEILAAIDTNQFVKSTPAVNVCINLVFSNFYIRDKCKHLKITLRD